MKSRTILVVDADPTLAGIYARRFEACRWTVRVAERVEDARKALRRRVPNAVLIDTDTVPDALAFVRELRAHEEMSGATIAALTRLGDRDAVLEAYTAGVDAYLLKGHFAPHEVCDKLARLVAETVPR